MTQYTYHPGEFGKETLIFDDWQQVLDTFHSYFEGQSDQELDYDELRAEFLACVEPTADYERLGADSWSDLAQMVYMAADSTNDNGLMDWLGERDYSGGETVESLAAEWDARIKKAASIAANGRKGGRPRKERPERPEFLSYVGWDGSEHGEF